MKFKSQPAKIILLMMSFWAISTTAQTPTGTKPEIYANVNTSSEITWNKKKVAKWYKSREWLKGGNLNPHKSIDQREFSEQYHANTMWWDKAFAYLRETDFNSLKPGRYSIEGENVYVIVTEGPTKDVDKTVWESHRLYNDIHYVIRGKEKIGVAKISSANITKDYDSTKDILFYTSKGKYFITDEDTFFIFFPADAHRPSIKADGYDVVKKIVIKIRTSS